MKKFDTINVIPFIDIMLVLLAIVLATASFISQGKIEVNVPQSQSKVKTVAEDFAELITITKDGTFYYKDEQVDLPTLETQITLLSDDSSVTLKVDAEADFQQFVSVTDLLKKAQLHKVTVVTVQPSLP